MSLLHESDFPSAVAIKVEELAQFLTELSVSDYYFVTHRSSSIGLGALLVALDNTDEKNIPLYVHQDFSNRVQSNLGMDLSSEEIQACKRRIYNIYLLHATPQLEEDREELSTSLFSDRTELSPDCVANKI